MNYALELSDRFSSGLGMITRPPVAWQVLLIVSAYLLGNLPIKNVFKLPSTPTTIRLGSMGAGAALLAILGKPFGLIFLVITIFAICLLVTTFEKILSRNINIEYSEILSNAILRPFTIVVITILIFDALGFQYLWYLSFNNNLSNLDETSRLTIGRIFASVIIFYLILVTSSFCKKLIKLIAKKALNTSESFSIIASELFLYSYIFATFVILLVWLGVPPAALIAISASLSFGIGFGMKEITANFISGIWILVERMIKPGDILYIDEEPCRIDYMGPRAIRLWRARDNAELIMPNSKAFSEKIITYTGTNNYRLIEVLLPINNKNPPQEVSKLLKSLPGDIKGVDNSFAPIVYIGDDSNNLIHYSLRFMIKNPLLCNQITTELKYKTWEYFNEEQTS